MTAHGFSLGVLGVVLVLSTVSAANGGMTLGSPMGRPDRLIAVEGERDGELCAEYATDEGSEWRPATIYVGATIDQWRTCDRVTWNAGAVQGIIPAGDQTCLWNCFVDLELPRNQAMFRLRTSDGQVVLSDSVDLSDLGNVFVADHRNAADLAGGELPRPWHLRAGGKKEPEKASIFCPGDDPAAHPLVLKPRLRGWHRIYVAIKDDLPHQFSLSVEDITHPVPGEAPAKAGRSRLLREYYLKSADTSGQDVCLALDATARDSHDASIRYVRFVPMAPEEVRELLETRRRAETQGRPFAGYMEQCTVGYYNQGGLAPRSYTRNEMRLHRARGATVVYVHVIRAGAKAWYHSDVVERCVPSPGEAADGWVRFSAWMEQGDPLQIAIEEARAVGLDVFADMGMNVTYITSDPNYSGLAERAAVEHPEYLVPGHKMFLDYRREQVRAYVANIARELMTKYDVDGINLDFARFAHNKAFDEQSLVDVMRRIHAARREAEARWRHPVTIATRIPSYRYASDADWSQAIYGGEHPWFTAALRVWAERGWIDRVMVCCPVPDRFSELSLERYKAALAGTEVALWGDLYSGFSGRPRRLFLEAAQNWIEQGLDGGFFFYDVSRPTDFEQINWMLRSIDSPQMRVEP